VEGKSFGRNEIGVENGFVRDFFAKAFETLEVLDGAAVEAVALGLVAEHELPRVAVDRHAVETVGEGVVPVLLGAGPFVRNKLGVDPVGEGVVGEEAVVQAYGEHAGFHAVTAKQRKLGDGDPLDGEELLGILREIGGDGIGAQLRQVVLVFDADDGGGGRGEAVFAGIAGGAAFAFGSLRSGGLLRVGSVGGELPVGNGSLHGDPDVPRRLGVTDGQIF
jgi:hypothetical protein